jgi:hypothetical protein
MLSRGRKMALSVLLLATLGPGAGLLPGPARPGSAAAAEDARAGGPGPAAGLDPVEYKELKPILDIKNQPWATVPWKYSITEARKLAAAARKPIFMVVNTGNALGCT